MGQVGQSRPTAPPNVPGWLRQPPPTRPTCRLMLMSIASSCNVDAIVAESYVQRIAQAPYMLCAFV